MAKIYLHEGSLTNPQKEMECMEFDIVNAAKYPNTAQTNFRRMIALKSGLDRPYVSMRFHGSRLSFAIEEEGETKRVNLIDLDEIPSPFVDDLKLGTNIRKPQEGDDPLDNNLTWSSFTTYEAGYKPSDWDENWFNYYTFESGRWYPNTSSTYTPTRKYYYAGDHTKFFYVNSGLYNFSFGISTKVSKTPSSNAGSGIFTGTAYSGNYSGVNSSGTDALTFIRSGMTTPMVPRNLPLTHQFVYAQSITAGSQSIWCQTYPVHFVIPAGMTIRSSDGYGGEGNTFRATKNTSFFGIISIYFNAQGEPGEFCITAMEDIAWKSETLRKKDYGDNTVPKGGTGPQKIGKYNPRGNIALAGGGGNLTNPASGKGFVIYKMTSAQFDNFMKKVYSSSALFTLGLQPWLDNIIDPANPKTSIPGSFTNLENILFIKNSPVNFPSGKFDAMRITIGSVGVAYSQPETFDVVTDWVVTGNIDVPYDNDANTFMDMEPYKSASIYCPLAGEIQVMPSYLDRATITGKYGFNLVNESAVYALEIKGDNGYIRVSKSGQCAKTADYILGKDGVSDAVANIAPVVVAGAATIATGGTTAPALATTAAGAATGFVTDSTNMSIVQVPPSATGGPYEECVYGGLRSMYLTSVKAERFVSDDDGTKESRARVMGEYSYNYIAALSDIPKGNFVSVSDVNLKMESGMTKAEYDKIIAYLKEGVYM